MTDEPEGADYTPTPWPESPARRITTVDPAGATSWDGRPLPSRAEARRAARASEDILPGQPVQPPTWHKLNAEQGSSAPPRMQPPPGQGTAWGAPAPAPQPPRRVSVTGVVTEEPPQVVAPLQVVAPPPTNPQFASPPVWQPVTAQPVTSQPVQPGYHNIPPTTNPYPNTLPGFGIPAHYEYEEPPQKKRRIWVPILVTIALFGILGAVAFAVFGGSNDLLGNLGFNNPFATVDAPDYPGPGGEPVMVTIPAGASGARMGEILYEYGVVASQRAFVEAFTRNPRAGSIAPGTYELQKEMHASDVVSAMLNNGVIQIRLVIPEGFTKYQVFDRIESVAGVSRAEIDEALADPEALGLPPAAEGNPEGWLFPATYNLAPNATAEDILSMLIARTRQELVTQGVPPEQWETILNKAALIEREVRDPDDLPKVARAIQNRIDRGINLQIDAAVAYGLGISGTLLTRAHLADASNPFNTYQHPGLPPTPIANPGAAAIRAAMNPADGDWIFWVTINLATGETIFTNTYAEHQVYVAQLRAWQAANPGFGQPGFIPGENQTD